MACAEDQGNYSRVSPDMRDLNYGKFVEKGEDKITESEDYNSLNTKRLDVEGMKKLLLKLDYIRDLLVGKHVQPLV